MVSVCIFGYRLRPEVESFKEVYGGVPVELQRSSVYEELREPKSGTEGAPNNGSHPDHYHGV